MSDQEILDNAPEGATHISENYGVVYLQADPDAYVSSYSNLRWNDNGVKTELLHFHTVRSLADIRRIAELELGARRLLDASTWEDQENAMAEFEELLEE